MRRPRNAFTLIELVASAVLSAMLMIALMNVVWSAARDTRQLKAAEITRASVGLLADRLRADFQNARGMRMDPSGITLTGFLGEDSESRGSTLVLASVRYQLTQIGEHRALVRRYVGAEGSRSEAVWIGFGSLTVQPLVDVDGEDEVVPDPAAGDLPQIPPSFRVTLLGHEGHILWREVVHHHAS